MNTQMRRAVFAIFTLALLAFPMLAADVRKRAAAPAPSPAQSRYASNHVEAYLTASDIAFIRPGLKIKVNSITIGIDRKPVIDVSLTDDLDQPLDRLGKTTPGPISLSFVLAVYDPATRQYTSYGTRTQTSPADSPHPGVTATQANAISGTFTDLETGHAKFTSTTVLPSGFDQTKTHTLGIYAARNLTAVPGIDPALAKNYFANVEFDFRPDGAAVVLANTWDKMRDSSTCLSCHDTQSALNAHGGSRRDIKLCVLCHQPQSTDPDTGNTVDMKVMAHKIHHGDALPSVLAGKPYQIIGNAQSLHDFSTVAFPQDIRNCATCHEGSVAANKGAQSTVWFTNPSRDACGACHDDVNWVTGANHPAGPEADDKACAACHQPDGVEFDASIKGAHTVPFKSKQLKGLNATVVSVTNILAGKQPTAVFKITNNDGTAVDGTKLATFSPILAGPSSSYSKYYRENAITKGVFSAAAGTTTYTFTQALPADASGTWTISADFRRNATLKRGDGKADIAIQESTLNPIKYVAVTGAVTPRRTSVTTAQCNQCHDMLATHGGQRSNIEECVICHNPTEGDQALRPANLGPAESISFQRMVHRIHTGENMTQAYTIIGFGGSTNNFNEVRFPGDTRNCAKCHASTAAYTLPLQQTNIASVTTLRDYFTPHGPATAACLGCHDNKDAAAHAFLNTANFPGSTIPAEACATCHGTGKDQSVEKAHAR
ncbi:MAG TPA: OmcA/MtrC family decaheme c-type cytochrome [Thermoanaerobaculia bacterium]|jgi:OmcA/MtrC family decaheme c-type cytochrome|nr:OmcA/MtrC family decaheme c-type cytochrome [Thermoanaerobaculia bacterium]